MRVRRLLGWGACLSLALALSSCGGGDNAPSTLATNATNPSVPVASKAARNVPTSFTFTIPRSSAHAAAHGRKPQYLPATASSLEVALVSVGGIAPSPAPSPTISNVGPSVSGCTTTSGGYTCTLTVGLPIGTDVVLVKSFDAAGASGNVLSQQNGTFTVVAGSANSFTLSLDAKPGVIALSAGGTACGGSPLTCSIAVPLGVTVTVADAHGAVLANNAVPGSPVVSAVSSNTAIATVAASQAPYGISLTPIAAGTASIAVTASPATGTSGLSATTVNLNVTVAAPPTFTAPSGLAHDGAGNFYVVNSGSTSVHIYNSAFAPSSIAGGAITTGLSGPWGVAVDGSGNIYVSNRNANNIKIFTSTGAVSSIAGGTISSPNPYGVAVDGAGNIYVASYAGSVQIFTNTGAPSPIAGGAITGLSHPTGVAVDGAGNIYVSDTGANDIKIFTNSTTAGGVLSTTIGVGATGTIPSSSGLNHPYCVAVDSAGNIYVGNFLGNNVTVFTSAGVLTDTITMSVHSPGTIALVSGNFYVGNTSMSTITVYNAVTGALLNTIQ